MSLGPGTSAVHLFDDSSSSTLCWPRWLVALFWWFRSVFQSRRIHRAGLWEPFRLDRHVRLDRLTEHVQFEQSLIRGSKQRLMHARKCIAGQLLEIILLVNTDRMQTSNEHAQDSPQKARRLRTPLVARRTTRVPPIRALTEATPARCSQGRMPSKTAV